MLQSFFGGGDFWIEAIIRNSGKSFCLSKGWQEVQLIRPWSLDCQLQLRTTIRHQTQWVLQHKWSFSLFPYSTMTVEPLISPGIDSVNLTGCMNNSVSFYSMRQPLVARTAAAYSSWPITPWTAATGSSWICRPAWRRNQIYESLSKVRCSPSSKCQPAYHIAALICMLGGLWVCGEEKEALTVSHPQVLLRSLGSRVGQLGWNPSEVVLGDTRCSSVPT